MFDDYLNPPSSVVSPVQEATAARPIDPAALTSQESSSSMQSSRNPLELLVKPKIFKEEMLKPSWIEAIQEEIHELE
ncbi:hypothetical protein Tco_1339455 [Tanacetum coccineum]